MLNIALGNWARDKGYGMGQRAGYIPAAIGGERMNLRASRLQVRYRRRVDGKRWRGLVAHRQADQWGVFFVGAILGMVLPALLYVTFMPHGTDIRGPGISASAGADSGDASRPVACRRDRIPGRVAPLQNSAGHRRWDDPHHYGHPVERQPARCATGVAAMSGR